MKKVAIVASHFVPGTLASVHRSRLWSLHLAEFGWEPVIVTAHHDQYEELVEPDMSKLVLPELRIIRTKALPVKPFRLVGDMGIRAFPWHLRTLIGLARRKEIDFCHITIPTNFSAPLGRMLRFFTGLPYGIDYIDPWVHEWPGSRRRFTKAWLSARLAETLEPWCVKKAGLITGINRPYFQGVLDRNPRLESQAVLAEMPYGGTVRDHEMMRETPRPAKLLAGCEDKFNLIYAGAMLPAAVPVLEALLRGLVRFRLQYPNLAAKLRLQFVGTGKSPIDPTGYNVQPMLSQLGLETMATEHPHRLGYLDTLAHLEAASAVLVMGSTEPHYSPSKSYQALLSGKPVLTFLHEDSTATPLLKSINAGPVVTLTEARLPTELEVSSALHSLMTQSWDASMETRINTLEPYSARESARKLALALDEAWERNRRQSHTQSSK